MTRRLDDQLPAESECLPEVEAADVALVVEIVCPGSRERDQVPKQYEYAVAAIPDYWVLDLDDPITLTAYRLIDGDHEIVGRSEGVIESTEPAPVTIDVASLLPSRA